MEAGIAGKFGMDTYILLCLKLTVTYRIAQETLLSRVVAWMGGLAGEWIHAYV